MWSTHTTYATDQSIMINIWATTGVHSYHTSTLSHCKLFLLKTKTNFLCVCALARVCDTHHNTLTNDCWTPELQTQTNRDKCSCDYFWFWIKDRLQLLVPKHLTFLFLYPLFPSGCCFSRTPSCRWQTTIALDCWKLCANSLDRVILWERSNPL